MFDWTGQKLGNYQILHLLGHGGFADVYLGQHLYLRTYAAVKVLQTRLQQNDLQAFLQEARVVARLTHAHIVRVLEFGQEGDIPYLILDYCPDGTLRQRHPKGERVPLPECVVYVTQVASALQYAHDHRIIHRDVKPENMLIGSSGTILLSDFGIATISQSSRYQNHQDISGTIAYSAPEQLQGKACPASDQYALGIVLYEWLVGEHPYRGSFSEIASQHLVAPIPAVCDKVPFLPRTVEQVLQKALAKDPRLRFQQVEDFATALLGAAEGQLASTVLQVEPFESQANISTSIRGRSAPPVGTFSTRRRSTPPDAPSSLYLPSYPPVPAPVRKGKTGVFVAIIILLLFALVGVSARAFFGAAAGNMHNGSLTATSNGQTNAVPTLVPTPTPPPPQTVEINRKLTCVGNGGCTIAITIHTIMIDQNNTQMTMALTLRNTTARGLSDVFFLEFAFEDPTSQMYYVQGQASNQFTFGPNESLDVTAIFPLDPKPGVTYTLKTEFYFDYYQDEQFTF